MKPSRYGEQMEDVFAGYVAPTEDDMALRIENLKQSGNLVTQHHVLQWILGNPHERM